MGQRRAALTQHEGLWGGGRDSPLAAAASQPPARLEILHTGKRLHPKPHSHLYTASEEYVVLHTSLLFTSHLLYICLNLPSRESSPEHRLLLPLGIPARDRQIFEDLPIRLPSTPDSRSQMGSVRTFLSSPADQNVSLSSTEGQGRKERPDIYLLGAENNFCTQTQPSSPINPHLK